VRNGAIVNIKILGPGCANCKNLERATRAALEDIGVEASIEKVTEYKDIAAYGVMSTPALVLDEKVLVSGRVPKKTEIIELLNAA
jgi:small redox-active disulfide protein 2